MITSIGKTRLVKVIKFLRTMPAEKFDYRYVVVKGGRELLEALAAGHERCGTTGCALGWLPAIFPEFWEYYDRNWIDEKSPYRIITRLKRPLSAFSVSSANDTFEDAAQFFGLDGEVNDEDLGPTPVTWWLFDPASNTIPEDASPTVVADHLQRWLDSVEVVE